MQQQDLLAFSDPFPEIVVESIRNLYPLHKKKPAEQQRIRQALGRIMIGEIDCKPRTAEEAVAYLREKTAEARSMMYGRERKFIPHATTFFHQSRYLALVHAEIPANLEDAVTILQCYPGMGKDQWTAKDVSAHMPVLKLIDEHIRFLQATHGSAAASYIRSRIIRYSECVSKWPQNEMQFMPRVERFIKERRYEQHEKFWARNPAAGFTAERDQLRRLA